MNRPKIKNECFRRVLETIRLPRYIVEWLDHKPDSSGKVIEEALIEHYNIEKPKE